MKLGKATLFAIIECLLFISGAIFFLIVIIDPLNPLWALILGMILAGAGVIVWVAPLVRRMSSGLTPKQSIIESTGTAEELDTYELHRPAPQVMQNTPTPETPTAPKPEQPSQPDDTNLDLDF